MTTRSSRWRRASRIVAVLVTVAAVGLIALAGGLVLLYRGAEVSTVGTTDFRHELAVPPLAKSSVDEDGTRVFDLTMQTGDKQFLPGRKTPTWGFNGDHLGPTLRAERGERVKVRIRNTLGEASTVHWHGMHLPAKMDGGPHQMVPAGGSWTPHWKVDQPAATLWYHPHPHGATEKHVQRGLAGMFILDDEPAGRLPLPKRYGVDDLPLIVQDVAFDGNAFDFEHGILRNVGFLGDRTMVNGTLDPYREVRDERVRLRLLNASTARVHTFGFDDDRRFSLVATDGGLLSEAATMNRLQLSPGERAEIVVRMEPGERTVLRSYPLDSGLDFWNQRFSGGDDSFDVLQLRAAEQLRPSPGLPDRLGDPEVPDGSDSVREREFRLQLPLINGRTMDMDRIDTTVTRGTAETWVVRSDDGMPHNFHVHDVQFRVLSVNGRRPPPELRGPKDTVFVAPNARVKIALRFEGPADPDTPYMYHCHLLSHEDQGMMGQFVVVEPGQKAGRPPEHHGGH